MMSVHARAVMLTIFALVTIGWLVGSLVSGKVWFPTHGKNRVLLRASDPVNFWITTAILAGLTGWMTWLAIYADFWLR